MPCHAPQTAWRTATGKIHLGRTPPRATEILAADADELRLPCGKCLGCQRSNALSWAIRCQLEWQDHDRAAFTTLTYDDQHLPPTLRRRELQLFLKRVRRRAARPVRFFASGEYGEQNGRPHYHALLFGIDQSDKGLVDDAWARGFTQTIALTPEAIAYVARYTQKKWSDRISNQKERVDPETGEVYTWQPPFLQMSRRPGIGANARRWPHSWRDHAIYGGQPVPVPRFLHEAWKAQATKEEIQQLREEKKQKAKTREDSTPERLEAAAAIARAQQALSAAKRKL